MTNSKLSTGAELVLAHKCVCNKDLHACYAKPTKLKNNYQQSRMRFF